MTMPQPPPAASTSGARAPGRGPIELRVEYKKLNTFFSDYVKNIRNGGTFIKTQRALPAGTEFLFHLVIPSRAAPFSLRGRVAPPRSVDDHNARAAADADAGMEIRFLYDSPDQRAAFEAEVDELLRHAMGDVIARQLLTHSESQEPRV